MKRRTSALSVSTAALLAIAAPLLTGCSTGAHPGAAAVVGDEKITLSSVQSQVETVRDAQRAQPEGDQLVAATPALARDTVAFLVYLEVLDRAADEIGVDVNRRDIQEARANAEMNVGGPEELEQALLRQPNSTPLAGDAQIDRMLRGQLLFQGIAQRIGVTPDGQGLDEMARLMVDTAEEVGVDVNPRYGEWDAEQLTLVDAPTPWLRAEAPETPELPATLDG
ncbi:SurA N-terminal domain-containing protein [Streptomyces sp. SBT349]|uniref:SurA N-terminal domain-containing protein n=1 Tax=Streptomyces sp. SBT349 TaxID=1580539 RepID=UPI00066ACC03|nr:SurA N-terminal domain-containing protein [Streptomyces sp. SBT349]